VTDGHTLPKNGGMALIDEAGVQLASRYYLRKRTRDFYRRSIHSGRRIFA
jgi:hypothetical protein